MANFDAKYENWKNKLLDLGKRNRLLNYKETKSSTLKITYPYYCDLYEMFVKNENELVFPRDNAEWPSDDEQEETLSMVEDEQESARDYGGYGSSLRTNRKLKDLQRVLRNLRNKAKVAIEEQGINILYLSFGFLKYTEVDHSKTTDLAPLVLVPVTLTVESITSPYVLKLHEDEIVVNPTLAYMLDSVYALKMPSFDSACDISEFFDEVENTYREQQLAESAIVYANRDRSHQSNVHQQLSILENLFFEGEFAKVYHDATNIYKRVHAEENDDSRK